MVEVVTETGSASRYAKSARVGWADVGRRLAGGGVDVLVTWEASRAQRDLAAYAALRDLCVAHGVLWSYSGRTHDLSTAADRFKTGLDALLAEREVDEQRERILRAVRANAAAGRPHGRRLYGYRRVYDPATGVPVGQEPDPVEAETVRGVFADYLSGVGLRTIARRLAAQGVVTSTGRMWADGQVRHLLTNPHYTARRVHQGTVVGAGQWEPIVDHDTFDRTQARLTARGGLRQTGTARLLTGIARCGICSARCGVIHDRNRRKVYACKASYCVSRDLRRCDAYVTGALFRHMELLDDTPRDDPTAGQARAEIAALRRLHDETLTRFAGLEVSMDTVVKIEAQLAARTAELETVTRREVLAFTGPAKGQQVEDWWAAMSPAQQREAMAAALSAVVIRPVGKGRRRIDWEASIGLEWRGVGR